MLDKNVFYIISCFWCMWSDHIFYCRPKLIIFQHNGLGVFCRVVTIIFIHYHLLDNVEEKHRPCILIYHNHIIGQPYLKCLYYLSIYHNSSFVKMACFHRQLLSLDGCFLDGLFLDSCSLAAPWMVASNFWALVAENWFRIEIMVQCRILF